jgi:FKBP-type peptidyl-prolyl cis-trans isomerase 2
MAQANTGDSVKVHYTGKLPDGSVFDSSVERDPLSCTIGEGHLIPAFEQALVGMEIGDKKTIQVDSSDAYGPHREELLFKVPNEQFSDDLKPEVGQQLQVEQEDGNSMIVSVTEVSESGVTLDANHPLAGQDLTFDLEMIEIAS